MKVNHNLITTYRDFLFMRVGNFDKIVGVKGVASYFDTSIDLIESVLSAEDQSEFYQKLSIRKKNIKRVGQYRVVYKAVSALSQLQKNIATSISETVQFDDCVQGFVKKRSTRQNASHHLGKKLLMNADIKNFFDSITLDQVENAISGIGFEPTTAQIIARICTLNGVPSQGLHTSPVISNLVAHRLDQEIKQACSPHVATYTRYADDISISSDVSLPEKRELESILLANGFELNQEKFRISNRGQAQYVTGLSVFDHERPRAPKKLKRRLRLVLHYIDKYGLYGHLSHLGISDAYALGTYNLLKGQIDYINSVEPELAERLYRLCPPDPSK